MASPFQSNNAPALRPSSRNRRARAQVTMARWVIAFGALALATMVVIVALLSDQAPGFARKLKGFLLEVGRAFEEAFGVDWLDRDTFPGTFDQIGHAMLWATVMFVLGLAFRRWVSPMLTAGLVVSSSILLEILQGVLTTSRQVQLLDVVANLIGIAFALLVVLLVGLVVDMVVRSLKNTPAD